jgi:hypothetical protein
MQWEDWEWDVSSLLASTLAILVAVTALEDSLSRPMRIPTLPSAPPNEWKRKYLQNSGTFEI